MVEQPQRYCTNCGQELKPEDQFCTNCGMPVHRAARVPTPKADRPVPPLPPPTQEVGRRRSLTGSGALRGRGTKLVVLLVLGVLVLFLVPPLVKSSIETFIAGNVEARSEEKEKPVDVKVSSTFPPMMLLGRIGTVNVKGPDYKVSAHGVRVSVPNLIFSSGKPIEAERCSEEITEYTHLIYCQRYV